jgi:hypothetical protein
MGLVLGSAYFGAIHKGNDGYNTMQRAALAIDTPQQVECALDASLVGLGLVAGSALTIGGMKKLKM